MNYQDIKKQKMNQLIKPEIINFLELILFNCHKNKERELLGNMISKINLNNNLNQKNILNKII